MSNPLPPGNSWHQPVLYHEIIYFLQPQSWGKYVDGTLGAGGHAWGILTASAPGGLLLGMDVDPHALALAESRMAEFGNRFQGVNASYVTIRQHLDRLEWPSVDGIILDLGVSSMQLDTPGRGFSFRVDEPLDMRFDPNSSPSAADLVNSLDERALADILFKYGEERHAKRIAKAILNARPIHSTRTLAEVIAAAVRRGHQRTHPATQSFQALRIAVNKELEAVETVLPEALAALSSGGRLAVVAFHSLEDRLVKQFFRLESRDCICPTQQPVCTCGHTASMRELTRKPVRPKPAEMEVNARARSARLRVAEKI